MSSARCPICQRDRAYAVGQLCSDCNPGVCVCTEPAPDGIGQCAKCARVYRPSHLGLVAARAYWIALLTAYGIKCDVRPRARSDAA